MFVADYLRLNLSALPWHSERLGAGFYMGLGNNKNPVLMVAPGSGNAVEPHVRYAAGMVLTLADGTVAKDLGQLVLTGDRVIGMLIRGSAGQVKLDGAAGSVYAFSARLDAAYPAEATKNRRGALTGVLIKSMEGQPRFELLVNSVFGSLSDEGLLAFRASLADLLKVLAPESRGLINPA